MFPSSSNGAVSFPYDGQLIWRNPPDLVSSTLDSDAYLRYKYRLAMEQKRRRRPALTMDLFIDKSNDLEGFKRDENVNRRFHHQSRNSLSARISEQGPRPDNNNWEPVMTRKTGQKPKSFHVEKWLKEQRHIADKLPPDKLSSFHNTFERQMLQSDRRNSAFSRVQNYTKDDIRLSWNGDLHVSSENNHFGTFPKLESVNVINKRPVDRQDSNRTLQSQVIPVTDQDITSSHSHFRSIYTSQDLPLENNDAESNKGTENNMVLRNSSVKILGKSPTECQSQRNSIRTNDELSGYVYVKSIDTAVTQRAVLPNDTTIDCSSTEGNIFKNSPIASERIIGNESIYQHENTITMDSCIEVDHSKQDYMKPLSSSPDTNNNDSKQIIGENPDPICTSKSAGFKRATGALRQLISLHEGAIARVSGYTKHQNRNRLLRSRHSVAGVTMREKAEDFNESRSSKLLKRHTAIGLPSNPLCNESSDEEREPTPPPIPPKPKDFSKMRSRSEDSVKEGSVVIETHFISVSSAKDQFENLALQPSHQENVNCNIKTTVPKSYSFVDGITKRKQRITQIGIHQSCQTIENYCTVLDHQELESRIYNLVEENSKENQNYIKELVDIKQKLDEQRKVANAYQKLEDRYRRQVHDLQQTMKLCTCEKGKNITQKYQNGHRSVEGSLNSRNMKITGSISNKKQEQPSTLNKVDGILNELEIWLNEQQVPQYSTMVASSTDGSSVQINIASHGGSVMSSLSDFTTITSERPGDSPLDIIDKFDATCV